MRTITPSVLSKGQHGEDGPILDTTTKITCVYALSEGGVPNPYDEVVAKLGRDVIERLRSTWPNSEVSTFPNPERGVPTLATTDPDFPANPLLPVFESIANTDLFLFKAATSSYGIATPTSMFFDQFNDLMRRYWQRRQRVGEGGKCAGLVIIGEGGARDLAACLLYMLNEMGFCIPPNACVVYEAGTEGRKAEAALGSRKIADQMDRMVESLVSTVSKLKGES